jgi:DNA-binding winged helix-turn-helix (wHTH) protein/TolB-like protein/Tfp pilus assembly protein PilF
MRYRIAEYVIDTARFRVTHGEAAVPVEPKVFDLLVYLIRHRERVLTREELFREVWEGRVVSDATLSNHVKSARKVLGDSGELQQTIQTIRGRGYQFIAPVVELREDTATARAAKPSPEPARVRASGSSSVRRWPLPLATAGVLFAVLIGWRAVAWFQTAPDELPYVVVVPFDASGDAPEAWQPFADQVTRELIRNLRKLSGLSVVPTPSAFTFKDDKTREHIRGLLPDAQYVLDGVVAVGMANTLRITAELEDLRTGDVVWDRDYEGRTDDTNLFALQSRIAAAVSDSLKVAIRAGEQQALEEFPTTNLKAYEAYVAGRYQLDLVSHESLPRAIKLFDEAIALDPQFFDAYVGKSDAYRQLFGLFEPPINMLPNVVDAIAKAQELRPDSAETWSSLGLTYVMAWRWDDAWVALNRAKRNDPTLAQTELGFALYYSGLGEPEKVKRALAEAERLDPLNAEMADWGNWALFMVGEIGAARAWAERKLQQHPDIGMVASGAGVGAYIAGDFDRAVQLAERGAELDRSSPALIMLAQAYAHAGQKDKVLPLLDEATRVGTFVCPYESAAAYLSIGDTERALTLLDEAVEKRSNCLMFLRTDPRLEPIRQHPHYAILLSRVGLDDVALASYPR